VQKTRSEDREEKIEKRRSRRGDREEKIEKTANGLTVKVGEGSRKVDLVFGCHVTDLTKVKTEDVFADLLHNDGVVSCSCQHGR